MENEDNSTYTIDISSLTTSSDSVYVSTTDMSTVSTITLTGTGTDSLSEYTFDTAQEFDFDGITIVATDFVDTMPDLEKVQKMCMHYPSLAKAFENFKTIYKMVEQDYKGNFEDDD